MAYEVWHREGVRRGGQVDGRDYAMERWHDEEDYPRVSNRRRGEYAREHHFKPTHGHDRHFAREEDDHGRVHYHDQQLKKPKADLPYFDGGHPYDWLGRAKYFFHFYEVPREARVRFASFHLEGMTRKWWRRLKSQFEHDGRRLGWTAFEHAFLEQWGLHIWRFLSDRQ